MLNLKSLMILAILAIGCSAVGLNNISAADRGSYQPHDGCVITLGVGETCKICNGLIPIGNALKHVSISNCSYGNCCVLTGIGSTCVGTTADFMICRPDWHFYILKVKVIPEICFYEPPEYDIRSV
ncbi:MAG: hypothetical protein LBD03_07875 [Methanobrevibacter sp.]|jgi:hypothetical protein|nr:hypothetical protein [Candidatus Methanovirga procula]